MEYQASNSLTPAIETWRHELTVQAGLTAEIRRELEAHLSDCMTAFRKGGLSEEESFRLARQRVGQPGLLNVEFKKAMNASSPLWKRPLVLSAWALYFISFFLPTLADARGYRCAILQRDFWGGVMQGQLISIHYELLTLANLVMLASPLLLAFVCRSARQLRWLHDLTLAVVILVWAFVARLLLNPGQDNLKIGCFVWAVSFTLLYLSALAQLVHARRQEKVGHA